MLFGAFHIDMFKMMILSCIVAFGVPIVLQMLSNRLNNKAKLTVLFCYLLVILYFTVFSKSVHTERAINLTPFWSYAEFDQADIRWQVYMNVFLYVPFGYLLPYSAKMRFWQALLIGICLAMMTETLQYIFALGLCETDDVIHNTLGCIIGYWYWFGLSKLEEKVAEKLHRDRE